MEGFPPARRFRIIRSILQFGFQAHLAMESDPPFRLIPHRTILGGGAGGFHSGGSFGHGGMSAPSRPGGGWGYSGFRGGSGYRSYGYPGYYGGFYGGLYSYSYWPGYYDYSYSPYGYYPYSYDPSPNVTVIYPAPAQSAPIPSFAITMSMARRSSPPPPAPRPFICWRSPTTRFARPRRAPRAILAARPVAPAALPPAFHLGPVLLQREPQSAAIKHVEMVMRHGLRVLDSGHPADYLEQLLELFLPPLHDDHALAGVTARSPEVVTLVPADGLGQAVPRAK